MPLIDGEEMSAGLVGLLSHRSRATGRCRLTYGGNCAR
jgi:hypothetical protein